MFIYTENTLNPIEIFELTIYNTKHTQNTKIHFQTGKPTSSKTRHSFESAFSAHLYGQAGNYLFSCFRSFFFKLLSDIRVRSQFLLSFIKNQEIRYLNTLLR